MKAEINKPFSQITFYVFHSGGEYDMAEMAKVTATLRTGIGKVKTFPDLPVESAEGREVFMTFLDTLQADTERLREAIGRRNGPEVQRLVSRLSQTCNSCHHFFRLDITDSPTM